MWKGLRTLLIMVELRHEQIDYFLALWLRCLIGKRDLCPGRDLMCFKCWTSTNLYIFKLIINGTINVNFFKLRRGYDQGFKESR